MHKDLLDIVNKNICTAELLGTFYLYLPNYPHEPRPLDDIDMLTGIFSRYTKRSMYFATNFITHIDQIIDEIKSDQSYNGSTERMVKPITHAPYFDFDAFVFSCKSIVEGNVVNRAKHLHPKIRKEFEKYSKNVFKTFINAYLNPIRNEVVHLQNHGSAIGSMVIVENNTYKFPAFRYSEETELVFVFKTILIEMSYIIRAVSRFIMLHECYSWGFPVKDIQFNSGNSSINLSDFVPIVQQTEAK
jgi:hypothetical protein